MVAALNDLDFLACDSKGDYLTANCREIIYTIARTEFGSKEGVVMIVKMDLYVLKSSGASFRAKLESILHVLNYQPTTVDPDIWLRSGTKTDGTKYWEMDLCYIENVLVISKHPELTIEGLKRTFRLKKDTSESSTMYLGANLNIVENNSGSKYWTISLEDYVKMAVKTVEY